MGLVLAQHPFVIAGGPSNEMKAIAYQVTALDWPAVAEHVHVPLLRLLRICRNQPGASAMLLESRGARVNAWIPQIEALQIAKAWVVSTPQGEGTHG